MSKRKADDVTLTVAELRQLLRDKGLSAAGKKEDLIQRLEEADGVVNPAVKKTALEEGEEGDEPIDEGPVEPPKPRKPPVVNEKTRITSPLIKLNTKAATTLQQVVMNKSKPDYLSFTIATTGEYDGALPIKMIAFSRGSPADLIPEGPFLSVKYPYKEVVAESGEGVVQYELAMWLLKLWKKVVPDRIGGKFMLSDSRELDLQAGEWVISGAEGDAGNGEDSEEEGEDDVKCISCGTTDDVQATCDYCGQHTCEACLQEQGKGKMICPACAEHGPPL